MARHGSQSRTPVDRLGHEGPPSGASALLPLVRFLAQAAAREAWATSTAQEVDRDDQGPQDDPRHARPFDGRGR